MALPIIIPKKLSILALAISLLVLAACRKEVIYKAKAGKPKVVLTCSFTQNSSWRIKIAYASTFGSNAQISPIDDAKVFILDSANSIKLQAIGNGIYSSFQKPQVGKAYKVLAVVPEYDTISAIDSIPQSQLSLSNIQLDLNKKFALINSENVLQEFNGLELTMHDTQSASNYYTLQINGTYKAFSYLLNIKPDSLIQEALRLKNEENKELEWPYTYLNWATFTNNPLISPRADNSGSLIFSNTSFSSGALSMALLFRGSLVQASPTGVPLSVALPNYDSLKPIFDTASNKLYIELEALTLSPANYKYRLALMKQQTANFELASEFSNSYTNIKNGIGIFAGYNTKKVVVDY
jgi:hypothetical protein